MFKSRNGKLWLAEIEATSRLGAPIMAGMVSQMLMGLTDTIMVGRLGVTPLAASSFVLTVVHPPTTFAFGLLSAVAVLTSQAFGAKRNSDAGEALRNGLLLATLTGVVFALGAHLALPYLGVFRQDPAVVEAARLYFVLFAWSMVPALIAHAAKQFCEALNEAWIPNGILFGGVLLNVVFNWALIYGNLGLPALGLEGAGWATLLARVCMAAAMLIYLWRSAILAAFRPPAWLGPVQWGNFIEMLRVGWPVGVHHLLEVSAFAFAGIMMGWISAEALASHQIAITCAATTFMFVLGLGMGVCIRVGQAWGAGKPWRIQRTGTIGLAMAALIMSIFGLIFLVAREPLARAFVSDPKVIGITTSLFIVAAVFQLVDGVQVVAISALRGISDVRAPALFAVLAYWLIALPLGYYLAFHTPQGPVGMWIGLAVGLGVAAVCLSWRFYLKSAMLKNG
ncbi:MAG TPA: MATE family efflux transporter [Methylomirabilota bacterium]|nr:MATE family efflux transporter [Methylomirabilota bacterium]